MNDETPLRISHDVAQGLQRKVEGKLSRSIIDRLVVVDPLLERFGRC